jgi:hypothetical protein
LVRGSGSCLRLHDRRARDAAYIARFTQALSAFQAELEGYGRPWGEDDIGSLIGAAHDEVSAWAFDCYQSALEVV